MTESATEAASPVASIGMDQILVAVAWALYRHRNPLHAAKSWDGIGAPIQAEYLGEARVAVAAMVATGWGDGASLMATTVQELEDVPKGWIAVDWNLLTFTKPFHADNIWLLTGFDRHFLSSDISLPARLIPPVLLSR
jgi:hypothetical protein